MNSTCVTGPKSPCENNDQKSQVIDNCGIDDWVKFPNRLQAILYLKANSNCNKEKFFYMTESNEAIVGPWNDATIENVSPRYRDSFNNGWLRIDNVDYHVTEFTHTHPHNSNVSDADQQSADWYSQWGVNVYILFEEHYYFIPPRKPKKP